MRRWLRLMSRRKQEVVIAEMGGSAAGIAIVYPLGKIVTPARMTGRFRVTGYRRHGRAVQVMGVADAAA